MTLLVCTDPRFLFDLQERNVFFASAKFKREGEMIKPRVTRLSPGCKRATFGTAAFSNVLFVLF